MSAWSPGPVYDGNFPDPFVLRIPGEVAAPAWTRFYAYATNGKLGNVQVLASDDLKRWREVGDAMPTLASWVEPGRTWAPEVLVLRDGRFAMYYTARRAGGRQAVGVALADGPEGPFVDAGTAPLIDQEDEGGSIDASPFRDLDGTTYLLWKNDGNAVGVDTWIYAQQLSADGTALTGPVTKLIKQDQPWEGKLVEGPFLWERHGRYYLFYAANAFNNADYAEGYAVGPSALGPFEKAPENPILGSRADVSGPGHASMVEHDGRTWLAYHGWRPDGSGGVVQELGRQFWIDEVQWANERPVVVPGF